MSSTAISHPWNDDIIREIFQHLQVDTVLDRQHWGVKVGQRYISSDELDEARQLRQTLANAALTCKAFSEPASKVLWPVLIDILPLIRTFSGLRETTIMVGTHPNPSQRKVYELEGTVSNAEWDRFQQLAARVRYLADYHRYRHPDLFQMSTSVLEPILARYEASSAPLLPNLRVLSWAAHENPLSAEPQRQRLFKCFCLTSALSTFKFYGFKKRFSNEMAMLADLQPALAHLRTEFPDMTPEHQPGLGFPTACLSCFLHLRSLNIRDVSIAFFRHLGDLTHLEDMTITLLPFHRDPQTGLYSPPRPSFSGFSGLKRFSTYLTSAEDVLYMLSSISSPNLTALNLRVRGPVAGDTIRQIAALPTLSNIRLLDFCLVDLRREHTPLHDLAQPFHVLRNITDAKFFRLPQCSFIVSDEDLRGMALAWPKLTTLQTFCMRTDIGPAIQGIPLPAAVAFAQTLPQLRELDIDVAHVSSNDLEEIASMASLQRAPQVALQRIAFSTSVFYEKSIQFSDVPQLARTLHRLFPNLRGLRCYGDRSILTRYHTQLYKLLLELDCPEHANE